MQLKTPPKWLRRPCGASFGFGGKLVTFEKAAEGGRPLVHLSRVVTETELVERSGRFHFKFFLSNQ
jgi:protein transport protein SEC31